MTDYDASLERQKKYQAQEQSDHFDLSMDHFDPSVLYINKDNVNKPNHYARYKIEPIDFIATNNLDWFQGNIIKYVTRYDAKNGIEDLKKAARYLEMYIKYLDGDAGWLKA